MKAVRYDRFTGIDGLSVADAPEPVPGSGEVLVRVRSASLNPGSLPALHGAPYVPWRDLAGEVVTVGEGVEAFAVGDAVLGRVQSWEAHAELVAMPTTELIEKPPLLSWDVAGSLFTTPMAGLGAVGAVAPGPGDVVVISGASGGVGFTAAQLAVRAGAEVLGLTSAANADLLRSRRVRPIEYGEGEEDRLRSAAAGRPVSAFIDAVGGHYVELALRLGVARDRIDTVVDHEGARRHGVKALGTNDAGGTSGLAELARLAAAGELLVPIARTFSLSEVQEAYRALAERRSHGRVVLHPQAARKRPDSRGGAPRRPPAGPVRGDFGREVEEEVEEHGFAARRPDAAGRRRERGRLDLLAGQPPVAGQDEPVVVPVAAA